MTRILILKTAALGDVLRTTSILPGLRRRDADCAVTWVTGHEARDLVVHHPLVENVEAVRLDDPSDSVSLTERLTAVDWDRVLSFDDELPMCRLATAVGRRGLSGAYLGPDGRRTYSEDSEPWFGMGLLARDGRDAADARKRANQRSHAAIFADMLGIEMGHPELPIDAARLAAAERYLGLDPRRDRRPVIGLNTGAGGRWPTKSIPVERVVDVVAMIHRRRGGAVSFVLFGGPDEINRNREIMVGIDMLGLAIEIVDSGVENSLLDFAAQIAVCDFLLTSDSLGMHIAIARTVPVVAFFAPTSAAEIELFGRGEKVISSSADYCSYRTDADNSSITAERLADAVMRTLDRGRKADVSSS